MFSRSTPEPPPVPANAETRFSLPELRKLHKQLVENKRVTDANQSMVVEILRVIAEMVVYGDNKSEMLFDFFCEKNMLSLFLEIMKTPGGCPSAVHIQILQTLSILISCVRNETSLYYLLSNNYINDIITYQHDFVNDESLCAQFASFMKTLSLKLNVHTVQFFFIEETGAFPILTRAVELLTIPDPMIRIASQSTILNVYRVEDSRARAYALQDEVMGIMFAQTVNFMENQYHTIFKTCKLYYKTCNTHDEPASIKLENKIDDILSSMEDWFYYLQDLLDLDVPILRKALVHQLIHDFLLPVLLGPLMKHHSLFLEDAKLRGMRPVDAAHFPRSEDRMADKLRLSLVLDDAELELFDNIELIASMAYMLQMLKIVTHQALQRAVLVTIFHPLSLDCRMEILREIEAAAVKPTLAEDKSTAAATAKDRQEKHVENLAKIPLTSNVIKQAWDRLQLGENQKISLLMIYIENILLERIVPTAVDDSPGNENIVQHEVDEEYLSASCAAITPLRTISDPKTDAIALLQAVYVLPPREFCEAFCSTAAVSRALNFSSGQSTPIPKSCAASGSNGSISGLDGRGEGGHDVWSSEIHVDTEGIASITADCDAEADTADEGVISRGKVTFGAADSATATAVSAADCAPPRPISPKQDSYTTAEEDFTSPARKKDRTKLGRNDMLMPAESKMGVGLNSADQLVLPTLQKLDDWMTEKLPFYPEVKVAYSMETVFGILSRAHSFSITTVQVAAHAVYSLTQLVASARLLPPAPVTTKGTSFSSTTSNSASDSGNTGSAGNSGALSSPVGQRGFFGAGVDGNQVLLDYFIGKLRESCRHAAMKLMVRLEGALSEMILNLVKEELTRIEGQKWKRSIERMYQDVLLFLPPTQYSTERMGLDFDLPISQVETIRKEIQVFILLRALYKQMHVLNSASRNSESEASVDQLCGSITDKSFLGLEEKNMLPPNLAIGTVYDMRGKRFLDVKVVPLPPKLSADGKDGTPDSQARPVSPVRSGSMWSLNTKRLFGSSSSSSSHANAAASSSGGAHSSTGSAASSAVNSPGSPMSQPKELDPVAQLMVTKKKILFVQDLKTLIIVACDRGDSKSNFKVLIAAPLLYTDAQVDPHDSQKFRIIIRSTKEVEHMNPAEPDLAQLLREGGTDSLLEQGSEASTPGSAGANAHNSSHGATNGKAKAAPVNKYATPRLEASRFLKARGKTNFYQLTFRVDSEQACRLAVQHIENKRKDQAATKLLQLQKMLERWSSEGEINVRED